ncbi:MAG: hypothetical protein ACI83O_000936 [Patescibacteria group bacterium]|jgi:hypothetical protein
MKYLLLILLLISPVLALNASIDCPNSVEYEQEFTCKVTFTEQENTNYDLKVQIKGNGTTINKIYNGQEFQRSDRYLKEYLDNNNEYNIKLKIHKAIPSEALGTVKIRESNTTKILFESIFNIITTVPEIAEEPEIKASSKKEDKKENKIKEEIPEFIPAKKQNITKTTPHIIQLNPSQNVINPEQNNNTKKPVVIYKSKEASILDLTTYVFIFFLITMIGILTYERW